MNYIIINIQGDAFNNTHYLEKSFTFFGIFSIGYKWYNEFKQTDVEYFNGMTFSIPLVLP